MAPQTRDSPLFAWRRLVMKGMRPFSSQFFRLRKASIAGRKVSEPSIATATTSMVPTPKPTKIGLPANSSPAIAVITVRPEMSTARPEVAAATSTAASAERPRSRSSITRRVVEHRVVHADGEADDDHELGHVGGQRVEPADRPDQSDGGRDGAGAEHEREPGGHDGAERDEQDDQQQDVGDQRRLLAVLRVLLGDRLGRGRLAELLDPHAGMSGLGGGHGGERLLDELLGLLVAAAQLEAHEDRAAVLGGERALDLRDALDPLEPAHHVPHGGGRALALDEHLLAGLLGEARGLDDHVAALGLAAAGRRLVEVVLADLAADHDGEDDEHDPSEDGRPAVLGAPTTNSCGDVAGLHDRLPP